MQSFYLHSLVEKLEQEKNLTQNEWIDLIDGRSENLSQFIFKKARRACNIHYGNEIYLRGLIEFSNYCKNDCYYCGIRCSNSKIERYRLSKQEILFCCDMGYQQGFRTFVLQSGEDLYFSNDVFIDIIKSIKTKFQDCALTLSVGEKSFETYKAYFDAGADRFLLRHETYNHDHYAKLHPKNLSATNRQKCLQDLKKIGFQVGTGFMVGSPFQSTKHLVQDLLFIKEFTPHMVGIGPFIHHKDTPFKDKISGSLELTLFILGLLRLMLPKALLPATTALSSIAPDGCEKGILAGANVIMPNLSPVLARKAYSLYDNKLYTGYQSNEGLESLKEKLNCIGYKIASTRGDSKEDSNL